jgi:hypothetical protein
MASKEFSAREAALIAQARAARPQNISAPTQGAPAVPGADAAERAALLMAAARAETGRNRRRRKVFYVWVPFAFMAAAGMWTLLWMWNKL